MQLRHYPRYLEAVVLRLERLGGNVARDTEYSEKLAGLEQSLEKLLYEYPHALFSDPDVAQFRWLIEELRVSLFAQQLKTPIPVSFKRVGTAWNNIRQNRYFMIA
jgi:ATP-dependent helicase HrpA